MAWLVAEGPMACSVGQSTAARPCAAIWLATSRGLVLEPTLVTLRACRPAADAVPEVGTGLGGLGARVSRATGGVLASPLFPRRQPPLPRLERPRLEPGQSQLEHLQRGVDLVEDERLQVVLGHLEVGEGGGSGRWWKREGRSWQLAAGQKGEAESEWQQPRKQDIGRKGRMRDTRQKDKRDSSGRRAALVAPSRLRPRVASAPQRRPMSAPHRTGLSSTKPSGRRGEGDTL